MNNSKDKGLICEEYEVFMAVSIMMLLFWVLIPCRLVDKL